MVEILSESTRDYDLNEKRLAYQQAKIAEIWFVDIDHQRLIIDKRKEGKYLTDITNRGQVNSKALNGFWLKTEWLWKENPPEAMPCLEKILTSPKP